MDVGATTPLRSWLSLMCAARIGFGRGRWAWGRARPITLAALIAERTRGSTGRRESTIHEIHLHPASGEDFASGSKPGPEHPLLDRGVIVHSHGDRGDLGEIEDGLRGGQCGAPTPQQHPYKSSLGHGSHFRIGLVRPMLRLLRWTSYRLDFNSPPILVRLINYLFRNSLWNRFNNDEEALSLSLAREMSADWTVQKN